MSTRIDSHVTSPKLVTTGTASRVTPAPAQPFRQVLQASRDAVLRSAEAAARELPGGPTIAAAFRPGSPSLSVEPSSSALSSASAAGAGGSGASSPDAAAAGVPEQDKTLYYLRLQEQIAAESQAYTALSNVMKTRHDTVKNAIGNIR